MAGGNGTTIIGRGAHVRGKLAGDGDVEIHGRVDGDVKVDGEVTVEQGGLVASNVSARRIVVRGAVKGDLVADEAVALEDGARVVGDVRAPRVSIGAGALVRGYVQAGDASGAPRAAARGADAHANRGARPVAKPAVIVSSPPSRGALEGAPTQRASNGSPTASATRAAPPPAPVSRGRIEPAPRAMTLAGGAPSAKQGPPPPVVPALKKGAKGSLKKKA